MGHLTFFMKTETEWNFLLNCQDIPCYFFKKKKNIPKLSIDFSTIQPKVLVNFTLDFSIESH